MSPLEYEALSQFLITLSSLATREKTIMKLKMRQRGGRRSWPRTYRGQTVTEMLLAATYALLEGRTPGETGTPGRINSRTATEA